MTSWLSLAAVPTHVGAELAYDEMRGSTALVGGAISFDSTGDVWEWRYVDPSTCSAP